MFRDAKVGDRAWSFEYGWGTITHVFYGKEYPIIFKSDTNRICNFRFDGKKDINDINPSLFWNEIKFEIPEKPFDFKEFIKDNLKIKQFTPREHNYFLFWDNNAKEVKDDINTQLECFQPYFLKDNIELVVSTLNGKGITKEEFQSIIKELYM